MSFLKSCGKSIQIFCITKANATFFLFSQQMFHPVKVFFLLSAGSLFFFLANYSFVFVNSVPWSLYQVQHNKAHKALLIKRVRMPRKIKPTWETQTSGFLVWGPFMSFGSKWSCHKFIAHSLGQRGDGGCPHKLSSSCTWDIKNRRLLIVCVPGAQVFWLCKNVLTGALLHKGTKSASVFQQSSCKDNDHICSASIKTWTKLSEEKELYECPFLEASNMKPEGEVQLILGTFASTSDIKKPHQAE